VPRVPGVLGTLGTLRTLGTLGTIGTLGTLLVCGTVSAQTITALRLGSGDALVIDGVLSEPAWQRAIPARDFHQQEPANGEPATEPTEVRVLYDAGRLVLGITALDSEPGAVFANQLQRDQSFAADDRFMFTVDTYADGRSGYFFEINPAGAMGDGLVTQQIGATGGLAVNRSWDGVWNARVARTASGWTAEIEVPLRTINFDPNAAAWGINFQRTVRRKNEESVWAGWARNQGLTSMASAGRLVGLADLSQGLGLDIRPYLSGSTGAAPGRGAPGGVHRGAIGGDIFYSVTPGLRANLTVNTDFAETDVDQRQVNLTRFALFFPEKRAFFLEGSNFFDFSRETGNAVLPFFSRRIGLDDEGLPQPIDYGAKLTGQVGALDVGVLRVGTRDSGAFAGEQFSVVRAKARFLSQSAVGAIYTRREGPGGRPRQTAGADLVYQTSNFLGPQVLELSAWGLSTTPRPGARGGNAFGARMGFLNDRWNIRLYGREVQDGYDPAVGFVNRRAYREFNPAGRFTWHLNHALVRRVSWEATDGRIYDLDGRLETRRADFQLFRMELQAGDLIEYHLVPSHERLPRSFTIVSGVVLPAGGAYDFLRRTFQVQSAARRAVAMGLRYEDGGFYSGTRRQVAATLSVRPHRGWLLDLGTDLNRVELREGRFTTRVWRADVNSQMSPWVSLVTTVQYDTVTRGLGWQSRFRWIQRPGNDVYVVYTRNWVNLDTWQAFDHRAAAKVVTTYRF